MQEFVNCPCRIQIIVRIDLLNPYFYEGNAISKLSIKAGRACCFKQGTRLYVSDWMKNKVLYFDEKGGSKKGSGTWGGSGTDLCHVDNPRGVVANYDEVFVIDDLNCRIKVFALDGKLVREWTTHADQNGTPPAPRAIALLNNEIFIVTSSTPCIQVYDKSGAFLREWGTSGFRDPRGLAVSETEVIVADTLNLQGHLLKIISGLVLLRGKVGGIVYLLLSIFRDDTNQL
jgi:hypothetical protein